MNDPETPIHLKINLISDNCLNNRRILKPGKDEFIRECVEADAAQVDWIMGSCISGKYKKLNPIFRNLNEWIMSTFHGICGHHLDADLKEFCYRFNVHQQRKPIFKQLVQLCAGTKTIPYSLLVV